MNKNQKRQPDWAEDLRLTLPPLLTRHEAAHAARLSVATIARRISLGELAVVRNGGRVLVSRSGLIEMLRGSA
jgi:hypothetical protein